MIKWKTEALTLEHHLVRKNWTLQKAADHYGVTKQRIKQVIDQYLPHLNREMYGASKASADRKQNRLEEIKIKFGRETYQNPSDIERAQSRAFTRKRQNAKSTGYSWDIQFTDVEWPTHCPILGMELNYFAPCISENSPSFDRIDNNKGYTVGNVQVISWRANRIKNDGTSEEHRRIADYLDTL